MDYLTFFRGLTERRVDYLLVGGLAVNFHGIPRVTYDIDMMIGLNRENVATLVELMETWGFRPRVPESPLGLADSDRRRSWFEQKGMRAFTFWSDDSVIHEVDIVFASEIPYQDLKQRAVMISLRDIAVPTISIPDLIAMKRESGRRQDVSDADHLRGLIDP